MSDTNIEKTTAAESVLADMNGIVEEKTSGLISEEKAQEMINSAVEAKSDEIADLKKASEEMKESLLDIEAKASTPATMTKGDNNMAIEFKEMTLDNGSVVKGQAFNIVQKRVGGNEDVAGGRVDSNMPFFTLEQANPYRPLASVLPASGGVIKLPSIAGISWASESAQPAAARTPGGSSASKNVIIETWVSENEYSLANLEDVPGMDGVITGLMSEQLGVAEADDAVAVMKAATGLGAAITTGVATGLPAADDVIDVMESMVSGLGSSYSSGGTFAVSRALFGAIQTSADANALNFDPRTGISTLFGRPIMTIDALEGDGTDGNLVATFGLHSRGLALCTAASMQIGRYDQTRPGSMTYFGRTRFKNAIWDPSAISTLKVGA